MAKSVMVDITNPEKVLFTSGERKMDIIEYYKKISKKMLPYLKDRPLALERYPDGIEKEKFYQKNAADYFPKWIRRKKIKDTNYTLCNNEATLIYLANLASITLHGWLSRADKIEYADKLVFDLDPQKEKYLDELAEVAKALKFILERVGMKPFLMTTGSRGLHIVVALDRKSKFDETRDFANDVACYLEKKSGNLITMEHRKDKRKGKIYIDINRNSNAQLSVLPYSIRPIAEAPVAAPLDWKELDDFYPQMYNIKNIIARKDPWLDFFKKEFSIKKAKANFDKMFL